MGAETLIDILNDVLPHGQGETYPLHEPLFAGNEWDYVKDCLDTGWVSSVGSYVDEFEKKVAAACGVSYGVATMNGTAALHIALKLAGVGAGDEVIIPSLTFIATANAVSYCGAVPHFAEAEINTLGMDPAKLADYLTQVADKTSDGAVNKKSGKRIAAIVPVHIFGHPVDMDPLLDVAADYNIPVVEDAAESIGSTYKDRKTGSLGLMAALSFNGNKIVTTGGGGAIVTNDPELAARAKHLTTTAKRKHQWAFDHDEIGYNYRLPNINAALGCAQLEQFDVFLTAKRALAQRYIDAFRNINSIAFCEEPKGSKSNYWLNAVLLDDAQAESRDDILAALHKAGYLCRPVWTLMHKLSMYKDCPRMDLSVSENIEGRLINLPSSVRLGQSE